MHAGVYSLLLLAGAILVISIVLFKIRQAGKKDSFQAKTISKPESLEHPSSDTASPANQATAPVAASEHSALHSPEAAVRSKEASGKQSAEVLERLLALQPKAQEDFTNIETNTTEVKPMISFDNISKIDSTISEVKEKIGFLRKVLESVTDAEFSDYEAFLCWERILQHRVDLTQKVSRDVNLCVAIVDYFTYVDKTMKNPVTTSKQLLKLSTQR